MRTEAMICMLGYVLTAGCAHMGQPVAQSEAIPPHICIVNVAMALDQDLLRAVGEKVVAGVMPVNIRTVEAEAFGGMERFDLRKPDTRFGPKAKLIIYVVNDPALPFLLAVPGRWSLVNVRGLDKGLDGDTAKYALRLHKVILKGLAYAAGVGANADVGRCVMAQGSFETLAGIDGTSSTYSPFAAFPLMDILIAKGVMKTEEPVE
jgi:hypothetical protein